MSEPTTLRRSPSVAALVLAALIPVAALLSFTGKAYHMDDPFYIWVGQHILESPLDFYGFELNWDDAEKLAADVNKNPPLVSYYMALVGLLFGWSERVMHMAFLVPAAAVSVGTYCLARRLCSYPLLVTFTTVFAPVTLISSSNVMAEVTMLAFYLWAVYCWVVGLKESQTTYLVVAAVLIGLATLAKYFAISLFPLLFVYALAKDRRIGKWAWSFLIPIVIIGIYEYWTYRLYGKGLLFDALVFSRGYVAADIVPPIGRIITGLSFVGGCLASVVLFAPFLWGRLSFLIAVAVFSAVVLLALTQEFIFYSATRWDGGVRWGFMTQLGIFATAGVFMLSLPVADFYRRRDADSLLLLLLMFGTLVFAVFLNWTINGRSMIAMAPAAAILMARRLEDRRVAERLWRPWLVYAPVLPAMCLAVWLVYADYTVANSARRAAQDFSSPGGVPPHSGELWYLGHWGFQYYMDPAVAKPINRRHFYLVRGDALILPFNNTFPKIEDRFYDHTFERTYEIAPWVSVWNRWVSAGFYAAGWGPLPFAFGDVPDERYRVVLISRTSNVSLPPTRRGGAVSESGED